jgi:hypothetical protein
MFGSCVPEVVAEDVVEKDLSLITATVSGLASDFVEVVPVVAINSRSSMLASFMGVSAQPDSNTLMSAK